MAVFSMAGSNPALPTYPLQRSVRLRSSASAYFRRANVTSTSTTTWTYSFWLKRGSTIGTQNNISGAGPSSGTSYSAFLFDSSNAFQVNDDSGGASNFLLVTTQVFRDPSAWYHFVIAVDTTQATAANRVKVYVNGVQVTAFSTAIYPSLNYATYFNNATYTKAIGNIWYNGAPGGFYFDGYLTEVNFVDGQALTPSSFGAYNSYGVWSPAKYTGTYGTNGFYLNFQDNSALTTTANIGIGKDSSGNGNYWTSNNISITAGVTYDSMLDVPTLTSTTNANFPTINPLDVQNASSVAQGNQYISFSAVNYGHSRATQAIPDGSYWEVVSGGSNWLMLGVANSTAYSSFNWAGSWAIYQADGRVYNNGAAITGVLATFTTNDVIGFAVKGNKLYIAKNGTWLNSGDPVAQTGFVASGISSEVFPYIGNGGGAAGTPSAYFNAGQRPFTYTPPTGFNRLNTYNLPDSIVPVGAQYMAATTYTGTGAARSIANTVNGASFQPDFVWIKDRSVASAHALTNAVTGITKYLESNTTLAETTDTTSVTALNSTGFSLGAGTSIYYTNRNGEAFVAWQWRASNASAVTNTAGTITSSVSANQTAGFSIVTYTGTGANATVGHGLGVAPRMVIIKGRATTFDWRVWFTGFPTGFDIQLNQAAAYSSAPTVYTSAPTSTVINIGTGSAVNQSSSTYVAYCFAAVPGYSAFGSYTGNGSTNGPFIYTGFRPRWIMFKCTSASATNWFIEDTSRNPYNPSGVTLQADTAAAEANNAPTIDILSNGFKLRSTYSSYNTNGGTYIYAAFAENPFKNSLAR